METNRIPISPKDSDDLFYLVEHFRLHKLLTAAKLIEEEDISNDMDDGVMREYVELFEKLISNLGKRHKEKKEND